MEKNEIKKLGLKVGIPAVALTAIAGGVASAEESKRIDESTLNSQGKLDFGDGAVVFDSADILTLAQGVNDNKSDIVANAAEVQVCFQDITNGKQSLIDKLKEINNSDINVSGTPTWEEIENLIEQEANLAKENSYQEGYTAAAAENAGSDALGMQVITHQHGSSCQCNSTSFNSSGWWSAYHGNSWWSYHCTFTCTGCGATYSEGHTVTPWGSWEGATYHPSTCTRIKCGRTAGVSIDAVKIGSQYFDVINGTVTEITP